MFLGLYRMATELGSPLLGPYLKRRARLGKEDALRLGERAGEATLPRPQGPLLWLHAASVGESLSALPLIDRLLDERPTLHLLVTTGTVTSAQLMAERLPPRAYHQFAPLDQAGAWRRFFDYWRPQLGCLIESEIWPNLILEAGRAHVPLTLVNGRMSLRSAARWRWVGGSARRLFGALDLCLARSRDDAERLAELGATEVRTLGDLKNAAPPLPVAPAALAELQAAIGARPVWLAASTHPGEEEDVLAAHRTLREKYRDMLTVVVPRHPKRGDALARAFSAGGEAVARRSQGEVPGPSTSLYLADTLGELGLFYRLASLAFIGGSLVPHGGHNPLEAARLGCPSLFGPHTGNFDEMTERLLQAGAARRVENRSDLARTVGALLDDPAGLERMAVDGRKAGAAEEAVLARVHQALESLLHRQLGPIDLPAPNHACA